MSKNTPGEYLIENGDFIYALDDSVQVNRFDCKINAGYTIDGRTSREEIEATARLFAAAPNLLRALQIIMDANDLPRGATMGEARICEYYANIARAAIAKAEDR